MHKTLLGHRSKIDIYGLSLLGDGEGGYVGDVGDVGGYGLRSLLGNSAAQEMCNKICSFGCYNVIRCVDTGHSAIAHTDREAISMQYLHVKIKVQFIFPLSVALQRIK